MAKQIRRVYPLFYAAPVVCLFASVWFAVQREFVYASTFVLMALILLPPAWMQYRQSKAICEKAIEDYANYMNDTQFDDKQNRTG